MNPKVSVIIPTYNAEDYLMDAVNSVINQTFGFENIELILVDDNSSDSTKTIINDLAGKYENVVSVFLEDNSGSPSKPRNIGIQIASTDYIMFMDNDDTYSLSMCEVMYGAIIRENVDVVTCKLNLMLDSKLIVANTFLNNYTEDIKVDSVYDFPNLVSPGTPIMIWNKIFKKNVILNEDIKFLEGMLYEDVYFSTKFFLNAKGIFVLNNFSGYNYNIRTEEGNTSTSYSFTQKNLIKQFNGLMHIFSLLNDYDNKFPALGAEMLLGWTKLFIKTDLDRDTEKELLKNVKPYYKSYKWKTRLVNFSKVFNIFANIGVKILSVTTYPLVLAKKVL